MKYSTLFSLLFSLLLAGSAVAQEKPESPALQKIRRTFAQADRNGDGALDPAEAKRATIPSTDFLKQDHDGNRKLSEAEFLLYYRQLLVNAKRTVDAGVEREAVRIETARRVRAERAAKRRLQEQARHDAAVQHAAEVQRKLKRAEDALAQDVRNGDLSREEAKISRDKLADRARGVVGAKPIPVSYSPGVAERLKKAEAALELEVARGRMTRAAATEKRALLRRRAAVVSGRELATPRKKQETHAKDVDIERRFKRAEDALKQASGNGDLTREEAKLKKDRLVDRARNAKAGDSPVEHEKLERKTDAANGKSQVQQRANRKDAASKQSQDQRAAEARKQQQAVDRLRKQRDTAARKRAQAEREAAAERARREREAKQGREGKQP